MSPRIPVPKAPGLALLALFVLTACQQPAPPSAAPECPQIAIVQDASELTLFTPGPGRDLTDVTLEAKVAEFGGFCETDIDEDTGTGEVEIDMRVLFEATRGPASISRQQVVSYFVAISDREENILARQVFDITLEFEGNRNRLGVVEDLRQRIPLRAGQLGEDFSVFIGFQLTDEQLRFNRTKLGR
ncbi:MAG: hypothetical protein JJ899_02580 [Alphaproteobacteria bacterium]|nr:hypothetical protein [Alphaproteobacteria bacterium]